MMCIYFKIFLFDFDNVGKCYNVLDDEIFVFIICVRLGDDGLVVFMWVCGFVLKI